jgi:hypothetical protein
MRTLFTPKVNLRVAGSNPQMRLGRALVPADAAHSFGAVSMANRLELKRISPGSVSMR